MKETSFYQRLLKKAENVKIGSLVKFILNDNIELRVAEKTGNLIFMDKRYEAGWIREGSKPTEARSVVAYILDKRSYSPDFYEFEIETPKGKKGLVRLNHCKGLRYRLNLKRILDSLMQTAKYQL
ncbi:MAG TPA: hypothetical protein VJB94_03020 [Candidatus Nanoarchaeia archaeon]|nr:hypothetical protein [Candidatus Nanoarchaeia archaeon]